MTTIKHVKKIVDGVESEEIHFVAPDMRYPTTGSTEIQMTLKDANLFLSELSKKLSSIPY